LLRQGDGGHKLAYARADIYEVANGVRNCFGLKTGKMWASVLKTCLSRAMWSESSNRR
jgi:hypothetical protein